MEDLWKQALKDYKAEFGADFDPTWNPRTEEDLANKIRAEQINFETWRSKHKRLWKALTATALPITQLGSMASQVLQGAFPPAAAATSGLLALVTVSNKVSETYDEVEQLFVKLEDVLSLWKIDSKQELSDTQRQKLQKMILVILSIVVRSRKLMKSGRGRRLLSTLVLGKDKRIANDLQVLEELIVTEDRMRTAISMDMITDLWKKSFQTESAQVVQKLTSPARELNEQLYRHMLEERIVGTGQWFKNEPLYRSWTSNVTPLLLLLGGPGEGKSYLATSLVDDLVQSRHRGRHAPDSTPMAYYFCGQDSDLMTMLKTMAYQIQEMDLDFRQHVIETFDQGDLYTLRETWTKLFLDYWNDDVNPGRHLTLVIDGLSEAATEDVAIFARDMVKEVLWGSSCNVRIAIFARMQIWSEFAFVPKEHILEIDSKKNRDDMSVYVDKEMPKIIAFKKRSDAEKLDFKNQIIEASHGVFEWARLLLAKCKDKQRQQIRKLLKDPPETLQEMIKSCFDQIVADESIDPDMLRTLFTCLVYAKRPVRLGEVYNMIVVATGEHHELFWRNIVRSLSSIIRWKSSRVRQWKDKTGDKHDDGDDEDHIETLEDEEEGWSKQIRDMWIFFGNSKIRDYITVQSKARNTDEFDCWPPASDQSECEMVKICLKTLRYGAILEKKQRRYLLFYPIRFMPLHLTSIQKEKLAEEDQLEIVDGLVWLFNSDKGHEIMAVDGGDINGAGKRSFWRLWIEGDEYVKNVQSWLKLGSAEDIKLDENTRGWMKLAAVSKKELFRPFTTYLRRMWLGTKWEAKPLQEYTDQTLIMTTSTGFLPVYDQMDAHEEYLEQWKYYYSTTQVVMTAQDLLTAAQKYEGEHGTAYQLGLAAAFQTFLKSDAVIDLLESVPEEDGQFWAAAWYRARAEAMHYNFDTAIYLAKQARERNPHMASEVGNAIAQWLLTKGDTKGALQTVRESYQNAAESNIFEIATTYMTCLYVREDARGIIKLARELDEKPANDRPFSILLHILNGNTYDVWQALGQAYMLCQASENRDFILNTIEGGLTSLAQSEGEWYQIKFLNNLAEFYRRYVVDGSAESVRQYLANANRIQETNLIVDPDVTDELLAETWHKCSFVLYQLAKEQEAVDDLNWKMSVERLRKVAEDAHRIGQGLTAWMPSLYYARWLREHAKPGDETWRDHARAVVLESFAMLEDTAQQNDVLGVLNSMRIMCTVGDYTNALAFLAIFVITNHAFAIRRGDHKANFTVATPTLPNTKSSIVSNAGTAAQQVDIVATSTISSIEDLVDSTHIDNTIDPKVNEDVEQGNSDLMLSIDAQVPINCESCNAEPVDGLYVCEDCFEMSYCKACLPRGPAHPVFGYRCGNHHKIWRALPLEEKYYDMAIVQRNGQIYLKQSWWEKLKAEWAS